LTGKLKTPHRLIWVNTLCGYYSCLDPSVNNINAQPHALMNEVKTMFERNWEYLGYDLSYKKFKAQVFVYLKNRQNAQKLFNDEGEPRPNDYIEKHWENMKHLITFESKQGEVVIDHAMQTLVSTPSHYGCGRDVGGKSILVRKWVQSWIVFVLL